MSQFVTDGHLGGYIAGGDSATYFPELWKWLVEEQGIRSVIDVGCGEGHALNFFRDLGCDVTGLDGVSQDDGDIVEVDYTLGLWPQDKTRRLLDLIDEPPEFDLCWSCEFVEHVEERYIPNFLATFACADTVLMTHAFPGQVGWHHVNCQPAEYWKGAMAAIGYEHDQVLTAATRELARSNTDPNNHYLRSGLAFRRYE